MSMLPTGAGSIQPDAKIRSLHGQRVVQVERTERCRAPRSVCRSVPLTAPGNPPPTASSQRSENTTSGARGPSSPTSDSGKVPSRPLRVKIGPGVVQPPNGADRLPVRRIDEHRAAVLRHSAAGQDEPQVMCRHARAGRSSIQPWSDVTTTAVLLAQSEPVVGLEQCAQVRVGVAQRLRRFGRAVSAVVAGVVRVGVPEHQQRRLELGNRRTP